MGIESLLQQNMQNAGLAGTDRLARNAMFPQSQMDKTQYAVPTQMPTSAETIRSDYDAPTNAYTGLADQPFAKGGIAMLSTGGSSKDAIDPNTLKHDPNKFADNITQLYRNILGRDPSEQDLINNVAALNKDPDAFGWIANNVANSEEAIKRNAGNETPYDPEAAATQEMASYGKWTPRPEQGGLGGFANRIGPYAPFLMAGAALAAPYLAGTAAAEGVGAIGAAEGAGAGEAAAGAAGAAGAGEAATQGLTLKEAFDAYRAGRIGLAALNMIAGGGGTGGGYGINTLPTSNSYNVFNPGTDVGAGVTGLKGLGVDTNVTPLNTIAPAIRLSRLSEFAPAYAHGGGISSLGGYSDGGRLLKGPGDGMSDDIPAKIGERQPARLADGEFVIPADVVSHLGNGSTDAGAKHLYKMMDRIRKARTGNPKQGKKINPDKFLPKG